jgi:hypothetical protein
MTEFVSERPQMRPTDRDMRENYVWTRYDKKRYFLERVHKALITTLNAKVKRLTLASKKWRSAYIQLKNTVKIKHAAEIREKDRQIKMQKARAESFKATSWKRRNMLMLYQNNSRKRTKKYKLLEKKQKFMEHNKRFFTKCFDWNEYTPRTVLHGEISIRAIIGYEQLRENGYITKMEMVILVTGTHVEHFNRGDSEYRFGSENVVGWVTTMRLMIKAGHVKKIAYHDLYYLTEHGKTRLNNIIEQIRKVPLRNYYPPII